MQMLDHFGSIFASGGSLECPWGHLGLHLCTGPPPKLDFGSFSGAFWGPFGDPVGIVFRLWGPLGPSREAFERDSWPILVAPGADLIMGPQNIRKASIF